MTWYIVLINKALRVLKTDRAWNKYKSIYNSNYVSAATHDVAPQKASIDARIS